MTALFSKPPKPPDIPKQEPPPDPNIAKRLTSRLDAEQKRAGRIDTRVVDQAKFGDAPTPTKRKRLASVLGQTGNSDSV